MPTRHAFIELHENMEEEDIIIASVGILLALKKRKNTFKNRKKSIWVKPWLANRLETSAFGSIFAELWLHDEGEFRKYLRMNTETYQELLEKMRPLITKKTTNMRHPITAEEKLAVTLRYLATGETYASLMYQYRIHKSTIAQFIKPVCDAIYQVLAPEYLSVPQTPNEWLDIANKTDDRWQFPNCFAAADGKHVGIICPNDGGSQFFNYKGFHSIVLLGFIDYDYKFLIAEVGCQGRISDGGVYRNSKFYKLFKENRLNFPPPMELPTNPHPYWQDFGYQQKLPIVFVADDAFPLDNHSMKPYAHKSCTDEERIFNYRLSRFRRISENGFGIWANRFRLFATRALLTPEKAKSAVMASIVLHNMLRTKSKDSYTPSGFIDEEGHDGNILPGNWRESAASPNIAPLQITGGGRVCNKAREIRKTFCEYFNGPGQIPWQWKVLYA